MVIITGGKRNGLLIALNILVVYIDMNEFRHVMTQAGIKSSSELRCFVDEFSSAGVASLLILLDTLKYQDHEVRGAAARALGRIEDGRIEVVNALSLAVSGEAVIVRQSAAAALGVLGPLSADVVVVLRLALDDEDRHVREFAAMALDQYAYKQQLIARAS
jgi:hypothetical protein